MKELFLFIMVVIVILWVFDDMTDPPQNNVT